MESYLANMTREGGGGAHIGFEKGLTDDTASLMG